MRIQILADNRTLHTELEYEHGLCVYLETDQYRFLLDCGATDLFIKNAQTMEIDLTEIDYVFISHGHLDHIGGLISFLKINSKAKIIVSDKALSQQFYSVRISERNISNQADLSMYYNRFLYVADEMRIGNSIWILKNNSFMYPQPKANATLMKAVNDKLQPDDFDHELVFVFGEHRYLVYTGCAHSGLLNILDTVRNKGIQQIDLVVGGFHLVDGNFETREEISFIASELKKYYPETRFMTGHCTGGNAYSVLKSILDDQLNCFYSGFTYIEKL